jgi:hypothetical protein
MLYYSAATRHTEQRTSLSSSDEEENGLHCFNAVYFIDILYVLKKTVK